MQSTTKPEGIFLKRTDERIPELEDLNSLGHRELIYTFLRKGYVDAVAAHEESVIQYIKVIPIIAMTANAFTEDRLRSKEVGMDEHIAKPVDVKLLMRVISELVENNSGRGSRIEKENME